MNKSVCVSLALGFSVVSHSLAIEVTPSVYLKSGDVVYASKDVPVQQIEKGNPSRARLSERTDRKVVVYPKSMKSGLTLQYKCYQMKDYNRYVMTVKNVTEQPIEIKSLNFFNQITPKTPYRVVGNTAGAVLVSEQLYFGVEHPMATILDKTIDFRWTPAEVKAQTMDLDLPKSLYKELKLTFVYQGGSDRVTIAGVSLLEGECVVAEDNHIGTAGHINDKNVYTLTCDQPTQANKLRVTFTYSPAEENMFNSYGEVVVKGLEQDKAISAYLMQDFAINPGETWTVSAVEGKIVKGNLRRSFAAYLNAERAHPYRLLPHYNSWYDLNIGRNDAPWEKRMDEAEALETMRAFRHELYEKRGVHINSYLWDDGWDSWNSLWDFHPGFPNGFTKLAEEARKSGATIGVWMSPCGGYGNSFAGRVKYAKSKDLIPANVGMLAMRNPTYYAAFRDRCFQMIDDYDLDFFKFDRMGAGSDASGNEIQYAPDMQAILRLTEELRAKKQDVFINATVGTWASPFWVHYADSIWRGGEDWAAFGYGTERDRWVTYRDNKVYDRFVKGSPLFPLNSMMTCGVIVGKDGPPSHMDRKDTPDNLRSFKSDVWMEIACGTGLQEFYVTPRLMFPSWWDALAEAITWMKKRQDILVDTHWIGGDPFEGTSGMWTPNGPANIYGYASCKGNKGIIILRNPDGKPMTFTATIASLLEAEVPLKDISTKVVYSSHEKNQFTISALSTCPKLSVTLEAAGVLLLEVN